MKHNLNAEELLRYALASKFVLRTLKQSDSTLTYQQFAEAIGMKTHRELWCIRYREQIRMILDLLNNAEKVSGDWHSRREGQSHFYRIVNAESGAPGAGFQRAA